MSPSPPTPSWTFSQAASALFWCISLTLTSLTVVSFPHRISLTVSISLVLLTGSGAFRTGNNILPDAVFVDYYLRFVIILVSHVTWLVYSGTLQRSTMQEGGEGKGWMRGYKKLFNPRGVGEAWELPDLRPPHRSTSGLEGGAKSKTSIIKQSRSSAVLSHIGHIIINFTLLCLYYEFLTPSSFASTSYPLLHRPALALSNFAPDFLILSTYHSLFAVLFISISFDSPSDWPPLFGPISAAYTVRDFWGTFWHRLVYRSFNGHSRAILKLLRISNKGMVGRLTSNGMVFVLSGLMHGAVPWMMGTRCAWRAGMEYWMMQPVAFVLEGFVATYWRKIRKEELCGIETHVLNVAAKTVGYVWVAGWLVWEAPRREGAVLRCYGVQR